MKKAAMSRFGLRSHTDEIHNEEYDDVEQKTTTATAKATKNKHKRIYQKKKTKSSSPESSIDQHKYASNKLVVKTTTKSLTSTTNKISLMCSLPLTRLSGFIEKLQLTKQAKKQATKYLLQQQQEEQAKNTLFDSLKTTTNIVAKTLNCEEEQEQLANEEVEEKEEEDEVLTNEEDLQHKKHKQQSHFHNNNNNKSNMIVKQQQQNTQNSLIDKLMCLYCDKLFTTAKMQIKHIEKFHMLQQRQQHQQQQQQTRTDRRSSVRNSTNNQQQPQQKNANCNYCKKTITGTGAPLAATDELLSEINLNALFMHLIECHADRYYGCKKCMLRFSNKSKLQKHMKMLHATTTTTLPYQIQSQQCADDDNDDADSIATTITTNSSNISNNNNITTTTKRSLRLLQQQTSLDNSNSTDTCSSTPLNEEPTILSRLGFAQNRLPTKRKSGLRLRRDTRTTTILPEKLRSGRVTSSITTTITTTNSNVGRISQTSSISSTTTGNIAAESPTREVLFRMPARNESMTSYIIDDDFYREVINNVRHNLLYYLDGKLKDTTTTTTTTTTNHSINDEQQQTLVIRSTVVRSPLVNIVDDAEGDRELHAASLLNAVTAFPTLLTAEQYGGDVTKLRRAHTKHSWKWKCDSAKKKYKLINEGGKMVKKMKPLMGLRDLSKLDMWTQLSMRQKFEEQQQQIDAPNELRLEKLRLNAQLNMILDKRLLPQISLEQNEQTIIKLEREGEELAGEIESEHFKQKHELATIDDNNFLSVLQLRSIHATQQATQQRVILSGEWARPRSYMCMLCGAKFDKLKSLEEHKMFRHSHIYCTHYEVVGRELLANNLLQHLFLPKQALARYNAKIINSCENSIVTVVEDESLDSLQSTTTTTQLQQQQQTVQIVSPTLSLQSCSSSRHGLSPVTTPTTPTVLRTPTKIFNNNNNNNNNNTDGPALVRVCTKCQRKCSGAMDLYRHMLDCSGDYIWSMVKKRKYRYYCGSKKRRRGELRKTPKQQPPKTPDITQKSSINNTPTPRQRPSDAESIKKMLENLPAKRVCKQIFPVDIKKRGKMSKKAQQQHIQRRKLLAKRNHHHHHLFKTQQRQTRARNKQIVIGKAVKKNKQQKQITKNVSVKTVRRQSKRNLRLRNLQKQKQQQQQQQQQNKVKSNKSAAAAITTTTTTATVVPIKKSDNEEGSTSKQQQIQEEKKSDETTTISTTKATNSVTTKTTCMITATTRTTTTISITTTTTTIMHEMFEYANSNASSTSTCTTNTLNSAASVPTTTTTIGATNTRKRSKRISDCIAMLTGKLEEKLKTEQQPIKTPAIPTKVATEIQSTINVVNESQQQQTPPKTPKRKAQSRRILKPPSIENIVAQVEATITTPTTIAPLATIIPAIPSATCLPPSSSTAPVIKPMISLTAIPTTTTTPMPLPLVAAHLLPPPTPQLPLPLIPKRNVATTLTVAATATPLSSVDSNTKTTKNKIHQSINLPLPLTLPLPLGGPLPLPTALPIQLRPILQSNINNNNNFEEPLNLSNTSKNDKQIQESLQNANTLNNATYRSNIYDLNTTPQIYQQVDVAPLDLSTKSYRNNTNEMTASSIANIMPLALTVIPTSNQQQQQQMLATSSAATSAALFINECNKHFYSNLDLLKIPQVRSQLAALAATTKISVNSSSATIPPLNAHVYAANVENNMSTVAGHMLPGATKATMVVAPIVKKRGNNRQQHNITTTMTTTTTAIAAPTLPTTRIIRLYPNKKEHQLTMNEEVINHIDDAINSVINAVKASLTPERADDEIEKYATITTASTITTTTNSFTIATVLPTTTTATAVLPTTTTSTVIKPQLAPIIPIKRRGRSKVAECSILTTTNNEVSPLSPLSTSATTATRNSKTSSHPEPESSTADMITTNTNATLEITTKTNDIPPQETLTEQAKIENNVVVEQTTTTTAASCTFTPTTTTTTALEKTEDTKISIEKELENISEQPAPPAQKKFRRRRKNELAAIVADQLLESFKIDKARRDSLKKLENLAYEHKSDDLFMTGMLLMSSTKRSVTINNAQKQQQMNEAEAATTKRVSLRNRQNNNNNTTTTTITTTAKRGRRAGSGGTGRRGKTLDNKNIIKLKSSLASFSIGIERQLTEIEAKKELQQQQQQQQQQQASNNNNNNDTITTTTKTTTSSILRPSILSAAAAPLTTENVAKISEQSRSAFACRDPRLNKNIHKETDEESLQKKCKQTSEVPPNDYEEEDNYLTEIAKNVNEKIMAAENEDFMFANDGLLQLDDTSSQFYSRPATSMSVRSAPNFDDRSEFGSLCGDDDDDDEEEHTNTEVMDMDLDDEMSVYTSFSQDLGRACGRRRRRRRRRSILLTRRPKKRMQRNQQDTEKFECTLCKKIFFSATSLSKHNMTLAHVSKVSEQEYLLSKAALLDQDIENVLSEFPSLPKPNTTTRRAKTPTPTTNTANRARKTQVKSSDDAKTLEQQQNIETKATAVLTTQNASHVGLNSDERLFFECCTILKGTQHDQENSAQKQEDSNNFSPYQYHLNNKVIAESKKNDKNVNKSNKKHTKSQSTFRDPPDYNKNEK